MVGYQLDVEPNLYHEKMVVSPKHPLKHDKMVVLKFQDGIKPMKP